MLYFHNNRAIILHLEKSGKTVPKSCQILVTNSNQRNGSKKKVMFIIIVLIILLIIIFIVLSFLVFLGWKAYKNNNANFMQFIAIILAAIAIVVTIVVAIITAINEDGVGLTIPKMFPSLFTQKIDYPDDCDLDNILTYDGHTYAICETSRIGDFWDAEELCEKHKGHLAVINTESENTKLYDYFIANTGLRKESAYFGYTDYNNEGHWYWVDGSPSKEEGGFEKWCEKPNNLNGVEDYALFWSKDPAYTWNDGDFGVNSKGEVIFIIEWDFVDKSLK